MPLLFNIYTTEKRLEEDPVHQFALNVIELYLKITDSTTANDFLTRAFEKYEKKDSQDKDLFTTYTLLDLVACMVSYANTKNINIAYKISLEGISVCFLSININLEKVEFLNYLTGWN